MEWRGRCLGWRRAALCPFLEANLLQCILIICPFWVNMPQCILKGIHKFNALLLNCTSLAHGTILLILLFNDLHIFINISFKIICIYIFISKSFCKREREILQFLANHLISFKQCYVYIIIGNRLKENVSILKPETSCLLGQSDSGKIMHI